MRKQNHKVFLSHTVFTFSNSDFQLGRMGLVLCVCAVVKFDFLKLVSVMCNDSGLKKRHDSELIQAQSTWMAQHRAIWAVSLFSQNRDM